MGFWKKSFLVLQDLTSLGGTARMRSQAERYSELFSTYELLRKKLGDVNAQLLVAVERVRDSLKLATRNLQFADSILNPLGVGGRDEYRASIGDSLVQAGSSLSSTSQNRCTTNFPTIVGAGSGIGVAAASWQAVHLIAHASTGTAMATLHGAAAANAGWAWFGGGSLATGGGGMAAGHLYLPGIATAVTVTVSATLSHLEANRLAKLCGEIGSINDQNTSILAKVTSNLNLVARLADKLGYERQLLDNILKETSRKVHRFGWLSHCWRRFRLWMRGHYYTQKEFVFVARLDAAVARFTSALNTP
jgi:hypothetical protein